MDPTMQALADVYAGKKLPDVLVHKPNDKVR
jgi:hypothetical protein